jgi:hypothetical protein
LIMGVSAGELLKSRLIRFNHLRLVRKKFLNHVRNIR